MGVVKIAHPWAIVIPTGFWTRLDSKPTIGPLQAAFTVWLGTCSKNNKAMPKSIMSDMGFPMLPHCRYARLGEVSCLGSFLAESRASAAMGNDERDVTGCGGRLDGLRRRQGGGERGASELELMGVNALNCSVAQFGSRRPWEKQKKNHVRCNHTVHQRLSLG